MSSYINGHAGVRYSRASIAIGNLVTPVSPIHRLAAKFQTYLHFPDPTPLYVTMGMLAGNMHEGTPVWMMLIGSSSCGKTALLKSIVHIPRVQTVSSISGEAALLSGTKKKEMAKDATGGLLRTLGDNGCLAFMDFTSVLSKSKEAVSELMGVLRELFDGTWSRTIGGGGGRRIEHTGRVCLLTGIPTAINRATEVNKEMGERCLYYRYPYTSGYEEGMMAVQDTKPDDNMREMRHSVTQMFEDLSLSFERPLERRKLETIEAARIVSLAQFAARCRSYVPRDSYSHTVIDVASPEVGTRMAKQLAQLYIGMELVGNTQEEMWAALRKVAMDSMSLGRGLVLQHVIDGEGHTRKNEIVGELKIGEKTVTRILEDLEMLKIVQRNGEGWDTTEWTRAKLKVIDSLET